MPAAEPDHMIAVVPVGPVEPVAAKMDCSWHFVVVVAVVAVAAVVEHRCQRPTGQTAVVGLHYQKVTKEIAAVVVAAAGRRCKDFVVEAIV